MSQRRENDRWMIYGAYGFTGELIARAAVRHGHRPLLAGRDPVRLGRLAGELGLELAVIDLNETTALLEGLGRVGLVVHAAGPFTVTSAPMQQACLAAGTSYIDITGELPVFIETYKRHQSALDRGICLISGCGFDVVPSDSVAAAIGQRLGSLRELLLVIDSNTTPSGGTIASAMALSGEGGMILRDGRLQKVPILSGFERIDLPWGRRTIAPMPFGDLLSAARSTGAASVTTAMVLPSFTPPLLRLAAPLLRFAFGSKRVRSFLGRLAHRIFKGPSEEEQKRVRARIWGRGRDRNGRQVEIQLEVIEPYRFTAEAVVRAAERIIAERPVGALTPSQAFGTDFPLEIEGTTRAILE